MSTTPLSSSQRRPSYESIPGDDTDEYGPERGDHANAQYPFHSVKSKDSVADEAGYGGHYDRDGDLLIDNGNMAESIVLQNENAVVATDGTVIDSKEKFTSNQPSMWFYLSLFIVFCSIGGGFYQQKQLNIALNQQLHNVTQRLDQYQKHIHGKFSDINTDLDHDVHENDKLLWELRDHLNTQATTIHTLVTTVNRLTNRTTNADVIDKLKVIDGQLNTNMKNTIKSIDDKMQENQKNISKLMYNNDNSMNNMQQNVTLSMDATINNVKHIIDGATNDVRAVQSNVTHKLKEWSILLDTTVNRLNHDIKAAEDKIHKDVALLQANVDTYVEVTNKQFAEEDDFVKYQLAGTFTLLGCLISMWHLTSHLRHYYKPDVQRRIMAVLWMVPIYGITSWLSLVLPDYAAYFGSIRDFYEAYAIYTFIALLIAIVEDGKGMTLLLTNLTHRLIDERCAYEEALRTGVYPLPKQTLSPPWPCCYDSSRPARVATTWLYQCKLMAMQFVLLKPVLAAIPFICWTFNYDYNARGIMLPQSTEQSNGDHVTYQMGFQYLDWRSVKLYVLFVSNASVSIAFYALLTFYHGLEKDLAWCNPWPKFLCIKGVVFMTFWQGLAIQFMASTGIMHSKQAIQIQNLLTCIEMLLASLAHFYIFPYHEWAENYKREKEKSVLIRDTLALRDFVTDMRQMIMTQGPTDMLPPISISSNGNYHDYGSHKTTKVDSHAPLANTDPGSAVNDQNSSNNSIIRQQQQQQSNYEMMNIIHNQTWDGTTSISPVISGTNGGTADAEDNANILANTSLSTSSNLNMLEENTPIQSVVSFKSDDDFHSVSSHSQLSLNTSDNNLSESKFSADNTNTTSKLNHITSSNMNTPQSTGNSLRNRSIAGSHSNSGHILHEQCDIDAYMLSPMSTNTELALRFNDDLTWDGHHDNSSVSSHIIRGTDDDHSAIPTSPFSDVSKSRNNSPRQRSSMNVGSILRIPSENYFYDNDGMPSQLSSPTNISTTTPNITWRDSIGGSDSSSMSTNSPSPSSVHTVGHMRDRPSSMSLAIEALDRNLDEIHSWSREQQHTSNNNQDNDTTVMRNDVVDDNQHNISAGSSISGGSQFISASVNRRSPCVTNNRNSLNQSSVNNEEDDSVFTDRLSE